MARRFLYLALAVLMVFPFALFTTPPAAQAEGPDTHYYSHPVVADPITGRLIVIWETGSDVGPSSRGDHLTVADIESGKELYSLSLAQPIENLVIHPGTDDAYFMVEQIGRRTQLNHLDIRTGQMSKALDFPADFWVEGLMLNPTSGKLYLTGGFGTAGPSTYATLVVDEKTRSVISTIPYQVRAIDPELNRVYVKEDSQTPGEVRFLALDGATDKPVGDPIYSGPNGGLYVNAMSGKIYIISSTNHTMQPRIWVIDGRTNQLLYNGISDLRSIDVINEKEEQLYGHAWDIGGHPEDHIIDGNTMKVIGRWDNIPVTILASDPTRNLLFSAPAYGGSSLTIKVIDGKTRTVTRMIQLKPALQVPAAVQPVPAFASTPDRRYFPETGHSISGKFKEYWEKNGGLAIFGYPITEPYFEIQYFERAIFEYHPENAGTPYEVLLRRVSLDFSAWWSREEQSPYGPVVQSGGHIANGFKYFYDHNGGLAVFGLPLTEESDEVNPIDGKTYTVQYFERARFEYHPEFKGSPYETELGLLGVQTIQSYGWR